MANIDVRSGISGQVWKVVSAVGDRLAEDDPIMIIESMKMEIPITAPEDGTLIEIRVFEGENVGEGQIVAILEC